MSNTLVTFSAGGVGPVTLDTTQATTQATTGIGYFCFFLYFEIFLK